MADMLTVNIVYISQPIVLCFLKFLSFSLLHCGSEWFTRVCSIDYIPNFLVAKLDCRFSQIFVLFQGAIRTEHEAYACLCYPSSSWQSNGS